MQRVFTSKLNIPFIPIDDIYGVIDGIMSHDTDDSFMLHFLPGDVVIETGFRIPQTHQSQSFLTYRQQHRNKERWVNGYSEDHNPGIFEVVSWSDIQKSYLRLKTTVEKLESKNYKLNEFSMGIEPDGCKLSINISFPKKGDLTLRTLSKDRRHLGLLLDKFLDGIPLSRSEQGGYTGLFGNE